jgi:hypothetical protein
MIGTSLRQARLASTTRSKTAGTKKLIYLYEFGDRLGAHGQAQSTIDADRKGPAPME